MRSSLCEKMLDMHAAYPKTCGYSQAMKNETTPPSDEPMTPVSRGDVRTRMRRSTSGLISSTASPTPAQ